MFNKLVPNPNGYDVIPAYIYMQTVKHRLVETQITDYLFRGAYLYSQVRTRLNLV